MKARQEEDMALKAYKKAEEIFRQHHGLLRTKQALELGISYSTLADMTKAELLVRESHGLYRLTSLQPLSNPDLVIVSCILELAP